MSVDDTGDKCDVATKQKAPDDAGAKFHSVDVTSIELMFRQP
jgi:hypothetical protein